MRSLLAALLGALSAFGLFWVMQALISVPGGLNEPGTKISVDFVRLRKDTAPETPPREPPKRKKPEAQPPPPEMNLAQNLNPGEVVDAIIPMVDTGAQLQEATSLGVGGTDRDIVPLVRVDPEYPPRARQRGIEGWVEVEFTITPVGTVTDAVVIGSNPPYIFDRAALQAIRKWKYNPKIENGVPVARPGVMVRLRFDLGKGRR